MIATLGILACGALIAGLVCAGVTAIATGVTVGVQVHNAKENAELAKDAKDMQQDEIDRQKDQAGADKAIQEKLVNRNLELARMDLGSTIAYKQLLTKRKMTKAAKVSAEAKGLDGSSFNSTTYSNGTPVSSG